MGRGTCAAMQGWPGDPSRALQHPQRWEVPGIGLGRVPDAMWMDCPCGTQAQEHMLCLRMLLLLRPVVLKELLCTVLGKPQSGAGTTCDAPAVPPRCGLPGKPVTGLSMPWQALEAAPCTGQACWGIMLASKACGFREPTLERG